MAVYGMTQAGSTGTVLFAPDQAARAGSIGKTARPGVLESAVVGRPHPEWGETVYPSAVSPKNFPGRYCRGYRYVVRYS